MTTATSGEAAVTASPGGTTFRRAASAGDAGAGLEHQPVVLQLAAASLSSGAADADLAEMRRSQRLREEIDRLKSFIPTPEAAHTTTASATAATAPAATATTVATSAGMPSATRPRIGPVVRSRPPPPATNVNQQQQQQSSAPGQTSHQKRKRKSAQPRAQQTGNTSSSATKIETVATTGNGRAEFAPLASLDFSINTDVSSAAVEPASPAGSGGGGGGANLSSSGGSSSVFDTPTMSGYLDCDELSDMVDDSLFEITNAGCLSRSVFNRGEATPRQKTKANIPSRGPTGHRRAGSAEQSGGEQTPTNQEVGDPPPAATSARDNQADPSAKQQRTPASQQPTVVLHGHDYSLTSAVPHQIKSSMAANQQASHQNGATPARARAKAKTQKQAIQRQNDQDNDETRSGDTNYNINNNSNGHRLGSLVDGRRSAAATSVKPAKRRSQSNSMLSAATGHDRGDEDENGAVERGRGCPICDGEGRRNAGKKASLSGRRRRFTFSLFNLFTGNHHQQPPTATCRHHLGRDSFKTHPAPPSSSSTTPTSTATTNAPSKRHQTRPNRAATNSISATSGAGRLTRGGLNQQLESPLAPLRLRDSIKITNQRKQRRNSRQTGARFGNEEVLLDLSGGGDGSVHQTARSIRQQRGVTTATASGQQQAGAKNKTVKFTTPDRVMFLSPEPPIDGGDPRLGANHERVSRSAQRTGLSGSQSSSHLDIQPPVSIIKRPSTVPKSSSYSQTEPSKGVDELLAKYERDNKLVAEINEKLNLTETISSNKTALDLITNSCSQDDYDSFVVCEPSQPPVEMIVGRPPLTKGELLLDTGEQSTTAVFYETEEVDEDLLASIQRRLDELGARQTEAAAGAERGQAEVAQPLEDFSYCDCNLNKTQHQTKHRDDNLQGSDTDGSGT